MYCLTAVKNMLKTAIFAKYAYTAFRFKNSFCLPCIESDNKLTAEQVFYGGKISTMNVRRISRLPVLVAMRIPEL